MRAAWYIAIISDIAISIVVVVVVIAAVAMFCSYSDQPGGQYGCTF
jgi:hypothetical protein